MLAYKHFEKSSVLELFLDAVFTIEDENAGYRCHSSHRNLKIILRRMSRDYNIIVL